MIRIVGLSATLPNYLDVARFLHVNPMKGLFFFDERFRPVPLGQTFVGIKGANYMQTIQRMDEVCYEKVLENIEQGHQVCSFSALAIFYFIHSIYSSVMSVICQFSHSAFIHSFIHPIIHSFLIYICYISCCLYLLFINSLFTFYSSIRYCNSLLLFFRSFVSFALVLSLTFFFI